MSFAQTFPFLISVNASEPNSNQTGNELYLYVNSVI